MSPMDREEPAGEQVWGSRMRAEPSMLNVYYCAGRDPFPRPAADELLIPYDLWLNKVHCLMLHKRHIMDRTCAAEALRALEEISAEYIAGSFKINKDKEDVHISIESRVAQLAGEDVAGRIHTARSRNDQTTTDCRLYIRDRLLELYYQVLKLTETILDTAAKHTKTVMPGFTHYQPAAITSFGHFLMSHAEALVRDLTRMGMTWEQWNASPLGAAAAFGTSWNIDREYTARLLGFTSVQDNSLDCITSRWECEAQVAMAVSLFMNHMSILSQDIIILSLQPRPMIEIDDAYVTGSSIMPQKRNPDFAEVTRAKAAFCQGLLQSLLSLSKGALSGYNRDTQWTKYAVMDLFEETRFAPNVFAGVIATLKVKAEEMKARSTEQFITAVDVADYIAREKGLPFRAVYKIVSEAVLVCEGEGRLNLDVLNDRLMTFGKKNPKLRKSEWALLTSPARLLAQKAHRGGPAPEAAEQSLKRLNKELDVKRQWHEQKVRNQEAIHQDLCREIEKITGKCRK